MQVTPTTFTIAEYAEQMRDGKIVVNRDYQRSDKVWPPAARSYLIDTILLGFPVPKLSLYQITDLRSRRTIKEIVDGQQRSQTIAAYANDEFRVGGKSKFAGLRFSQLDELDSSAFLSYQLSVDLFSNATPDQIREVFRRINSYTIPLNRQELRHATYQGEFKWFIVGLSEEYSETLKRIGVFQERQLSRMADATMFTDVCYSLDNGIRSQSEPELDKYYKTHDEAFDNERFQQRFDAAFTTILQWEPIHKTSLMKPHVFFTLLLAIMHHQFPAEALSEDYEVAVPGPFNDDVALTNLTTLAAALDEPDYANFAEWLEANAETTHRIRQRRVRFQHLCRALENQLI